MEIQPLDPIHYLPCPRVDVRAGISLGRMLLAAIPEGPSPGVLAAAEALEIAVEDLATLWTARLELRTSEDIRPYDHRLDRAWAAIESSLARYTNLDHEHADHDRAGELAALLFPTGLDFTQLPYLRQHAESDRRIELIEAEGLREDLERLVGEMFIDDLYEAHQAYGTALRITDTSEDSEPPRPVSLTVPLRTLTRTISRYILQVLAFADIDPERITVARRALEPVDLVRRANSRRNSGNRTTTMRTDEVPAAESSVNGPQPTPATSAA